MGKATQAVLAKFGISTIGELAACDQRFLEKHLGKTGAALWRNANGLDTEPVRLTSDVREVKSVGHSVTFRRNLIGLEDIRVGTLALADEVASRLRRQGLKCQTVQVQIKSADLSVIQRQKAVGHPTNAAREIYQLALELIRASWNLSAPIRMLTITGVNLTDQDIGEQLSLEGGNSFERRERRERLESALDQVRARYGKESVSFGALVDAELLQEDEEE